MTAHPEGTYVLYDDAEKAIADATAEYKDKLTSIALLLTDTRTPTDIMGKAVDIIKRGNE